MDNEDKENPWKVASLGMEFTSAILVGLAVGYIIDSWANTMPWFMVIFVVLGMGAGLMNVIRAMKDIATDFHSDKKDEEGKKK